MPTPKRTYVIGPAAGRGPCEGCGDVAAKRGDPALVEAVAAGGLLVGEAPPEGVHLVG